MITTDDTSNRPTAKELVAVFGPAVLAGAFTISAAVWSAQSPSRQELVEQIRARDEANAQLTQNIAVLTAKTALLDSQLAAIDAQVSTLPIDAAKKVDLQKNISEFSKSVAVFHVKSSDWNRAVANEGQLKSYDQMNFDNNLKLDEELKLKDQSGYLLPSFINAANAAAKAKPPAMESQSFLDRLGLKFAVVIALSLLLFIYFGAIYAFTGDADKRQFARKSLTNLTTFWFGLAGGATLP